MLDRLTIERALKVSAGAPLIVALSGGGDSVALVHELRGQLSVDGLIAIVVDHALREGSGADARRARGFAQALGLRGEIVTLDWAGAPKRAQQAARRARYAALCDAARRLGARVIAVAHTADDQAETLMMRAAGGSGWRGLAGMAPFASAPIWPEGRGLFVARPLLGVRRAELRDALRAQGAEWLDDPANTNTAFERVRVRQRLAELEAAGFDPLRLCALASHLRPHADALDAAAFALISSAARFVDDWIHIDRAAWVGDGEVRRRALSAMIAAAAGASREPAQDALARLEARLGAAEFTGASLGGACLVRAGASIEIGRDPGALLGRADGAPPVAPMSLPAGAEVVWDGRLALFAGVEGARVAAGPAGIVIDGSPGPKPLNQAGNVVSRWLLYERVAHVLGKRG